MSFRPRMIAQTRAYRTLRPLSVRSWTGVVADVWHVRGEAGGGGSYISPDPRLVVFLGTPPAAMGLRACREDGFRRGVAGFYVPAGAPLWTDMASGAEFAHLDLHLQIGPLLQRLGRLAPALPDRTLMIADPSRIQPIAALMAAEVENPARPAMMLDGLLSALLAEALTLPPEDRDDTRGGLTPRQMAAVERHLADHLADRICVADLAAAAGLSESWFSRSFRKTTGDQPQRWLLARRIEAARDLIQHQADRPLADIALATGFADQAHLSRAFRATHGLPPAQWRRSLGGEGDLNASRQTATVSFKNGAKS